jgi:hypothetical protein
MASASDYLEHQANALFDLAHVLHEAGRDAEALEAARAALELYERKGIIPSAGRARDLITRWSA